MTDHYLLMTATPHKGDPENFCLFLELLDRDVYGSVESLEEPNKRAKNRSLQWCPVATGMSQLPLNRFGATSGGRRARCRSFSLIRTALS
jgi:hypothetical protein